MSELDEDSVIVVSMPSAVADGIEITTIKGTFEPPYLRGPMLADVVRVSVDTIAVASGMVTLAMSKAALTEYCARLVDRLKGGKSGAPNLSVEYRGGNVSFSLKSDVSSHVVFEAISELVLASEQDSDETATTRGEASQPSSEEGSQT